MAFIPTEDLERMQWKDSEGRANEAENKLVLLLRHLQSRNGFEAVAAGALLHDPIGGVVFILHLLADLQLATLERKKERKKERSKTFISTGFLTA